MQEKIRHIESKGLSMKTINRLGGGGGTGKNKIKRPIKNKQTLGSQLQQYFINQAMNKNIQESFISDLERRLPNKDVKSIEEKKTKSVIEHEVLKTEAILNQKDIKLEIMQKDDIDDCSEKSNILADNFSPEKSNEIPRSSIV